MVRASGTRIRWPDLPHRVRDAVEGILGAPVVEAVSQAGGFSPGTADRVVTADGRRAFVKAVSPALNPRTPGMHRAEARNTAALPADLPAPRLLGTFDDGDWIALVLEDVDGRHPHTPWVPEEIDAVLATLRRLAVPITGLPSLRDELAPEFARAAAFPDLAGPAERGLAALGGTSLVHCDIRADNLLLRPDGEVVVIDWPAACAGAPWFDTLTLALNVRLHGGHLPDAVIDAPEDAVTGCIAGLAALFLGRAAEPPPPGLPTIREFQRVQGEVCLAWLAERQRAATTP